MKFRLKLWLLELEIQTPEPEQVSTADVIASVWQAIAANPMHISLCTEDETEE
ncbi:hypothetical protein IU451_29165 [Nocardia cyriacigeorgica]|uniref:hypothetical protein n=1 Tax=Nocardia cyriacigeorgica TaxID=135487 RepID=UPI0018962E14|nr:hypothetical protein [Nocardia cyriacigeorgica]MBF6326571.1 hypothetical protein [Nocardia cyriacigeorgica]